MVKLTRSTLGLQPILEALPKLKPGELLQVEQRVIALKQFLPAPKMRDHNPTDWLLDGIIMELEARGLGASIPPKGAFPRLKPWKDYLRVRPDLQHWANQRAGVTFTRTEWAVFGTLAARILANHLASFTEVNIRTMLVHVDELPEAFQKAFPGYAESRFLGMLIRAQGRELRS